MELVTITVQIFHTSREVNGSGDANDIMHRGGINGRDDFLNFK